MPRITDTISIHESELSESFVRASGPGGQNVNKVSSAVQLRFDARNSPSLPNDVAVRLMRLFGGVHLLPFFTPIDGADAGFDPVDHTEVDCRPRTEFVNGHGLEDGAAKMGVDREAGICHSVV